MHKIKLIGPKDLIQYLSLLGIETYPAQTTEEAKNALEQATKHHTALVFITEKLAQPLIEEIETLNQKPETNIVLIPDHTGSTGLLSGRIHNLVRNSIGAEVIIRK
ncbi:MAG: hypothetical protein NT099_08825 [Candidatus Saganbacteria bacterium]|nr:hypothetical protein [Candidatus Saganbacteria bacterium]